MRSFRRHMTAASLKRSDNRPPPANPRAFPPSHDGGLIEACRDCVWADRLDTFPPSHDGGLIEAYEAPFSRGMAATFPPSHDGGLIEAYYGRRQLVGSATFPPSHDGGLIEAFGVQITDGQFYPLSAVT